MLVEKEFNLDSKIELPIDLIKYTKGQWVIYLSPSKAVWYVTPNDEHSIVFSLFQKGKTINEILKIFESEQSIQSSQTIEIVQDVLAEILDKEEKTIFPPKYNTLKIFITNNCNLKCLHCYRYKETKQFDELTISDWTRIIKEHKNLGGDSILISGGEPFLELEKLKSILKIAKSDDLKTAVITNASLLNEKIISDTINFIDEIQISLDGPEPISADYVRGSRNYEHVMASLKILAKTNVKIFLAMTPIPQTLNAFKRELPSFITSLNNEFGNDRIIVKLTREILDGREIEKMNALDKAVFESEIRNIENKIYGEEYNDILNSTFYEPYLKQKSCGIGSSLGVQPNGNIYACDLDTTIVSNVKKESLSEIRIKLAKIESSNSVDKLEQCKDCNLRYLCGGPCRIEIDDFKCSEDYKNNILESLIRLNQYRYDI